jgi:DNA/RNA-binding domain of Phe-tRNA-synthetase-like protein
VAELMDVAPDPGHRLRIEPEVRRRFPGYAALVIYAHGLGNGPSDAFSVGRLREAERVQRLAFAGREAGSHPHLAAWREAFRAFGRKPRRAPCSAEALLGRVLRGEELPAINRLVDLYNAVSLARVLPVGGEDLEQVASDPTVCLARGGEPFDTVRDGVALVEAVPEGEVVWLDRKGVTCRAWNWRQCVRTRLSQSTRHAYFVLDRLEPYPLEELRAAGEELSELVRAASPGCRLETTMLGPESR